MQNWEQRLKAAKARLDGISPSFCAAKWLQVTLLLQTGQTRSCHHAPAHAVPRRGLADNPSLLHNTPHKKRMRQAMQAGERPSECDYCWEMERASVLYSDRHIKSGDPWAFPFLGELAAARWDEDTVPTYLEVSFGLECGLRCLYCYPSVSSSVLADYRANGPYQVTYPMDAARLKRVHNFSAGAELPAGDNEYVKAFWQWFPELPGRLKVLRITGGEPLLNANTFRVLDFLEAHPAPGLELSVNSSLSVEPAVYDRFLRQSRRLLDGGKVASLSLFTSLEAHGAQSDYIRHGSSYAGIMANCRRWLQAMPRSRLVFMSTFNALSFTSFPGLVGDVLALKREYDNKDRLVMLDVSPLSDPYYLRPAIATPALREPLLRSLELMRENRKEDGKGFLPYEINKVSRMYDGLSSGALRWPNLYVSRKDFARFIRECDRRRGSDFAAVFPEMAPFMERCRSLWNAALAVTVLR